MSRIDPRPRELTVIRPIRFDTLAPCLLRLIQLPLPSLIRRSNRNPTIGLPRPCRHCRQPVHSHSGCPGNPGLNAPQPGRLAGRSDRDGADDLRVGRTPGPRPSGSASRSAEQEMNGYANPASGPGKSAFSAQQVRFRPAHREPARGVADELQLRSATAVRRQPGSDQERVRADRVEGLAAESELDRDYVVGGRAGAGGPDRGTRAVGALAYWSDVSPELGA